MEQDVAPRLGVQQGSTVCTARSIDLGSYSDFVLPTELEGFKVRNVTSDDEMSERVEAFINKVK